MSYTISNLKTDLSGMLHGTSTAKVTGLDELIARAGRDLLLDIDPQETIRTTQLTNALYDQVYDYAAPSDLKGNKIIDIRPQAGRTLADGFTQTSAREFDRYKTNGQFQVRHNSGTKTIRIAKSLTPGEVLHDMNSVTANGTWAVGGGAASISADTVYKLSGSASIAFNVTGATTSYIENDSFTDVDLTDHSSKSALFVYVFMPTASQVTSVSLRWGNDSSNYYSASATTAHPGSTFQDGWNLVRFDWSSATETGTVDDSAIDYLRLSIVHTATNTNYRVENIISILPTIYEVEYYSKFIFRTSAGTWQETVTDDTNIINLDTDAYNLLLNKVMYLAAPQVQAEDSVFDAGFYRNEYVNGVKEYTNNYKSQKQQSQQSYYRF